MASYSTVQVANGHTLTIVDKIDGAGNRYFQVQERDATGAFVRVAHEAKALLYAQNWIDRSLACHPRYATNG